MIKCKVCGGSHTGTICDGSGPLAKKLASSSMVEPPTVNRAVEGSNPSSSASSTAPKGSRSRRRETANENSPVDTMEGLGTSEPTGRNVVSGETGNATTVAPAPKAVEARIPPPSTKSIPKPTAGERLIAAAREALAIAKGEAEPYKTYEMGKTSKRGRPQIHPDRKAYKAKKMREYRARDKESGQK